MTVDVLERITRRSIVSEAARVAETQEGQERFIDPRSKTSFLFDHLSLEASDSQPAEPDADSEPFRAALEKATLTYLAAHFHDGVSSIFASKGGTNRFIIQVVANKYNPSNYWAGRWRSEYTIDLNENTRSKVAGSTFDNAHDILVTATAIVTSSPSSSASKILALIEDEEGKYQTSLNDTYQEMGEKTFKGLRRALPLTRQKLDWDKVLGYKWEPSLRQQGMFGGS
ncbi:F-actin capping protein alpha subunit [Mycena leptocephala]|nr:F-actin capping protein alpha subunit [Mycena leptocephala]